MTERITSSSELRGFVADNTGRRKIDTEASLELHIRAATQIDLLGQQVNELERRATDVTQVAAPAPAPPAPAPTTTDEGASSSAMMLLRNAQTAADETLAEANAMRSQAAATLSDAEANARSLAESAIADARIQAEAMLNDAEARAQTTISDAEYRARTTVSTAEDEAEAARMGAESEVLRIVEAARADAQSLTMANDQVRDRAGFIQRQYVDKALQVQRDADALADFSRQVVTFAESDMTLPEFDPTGSLERAQLSAMPAGVAATAQAATVEPSTAPAEPFAPVPEHGATAAEHVGPTHEAAAVFDEPPAPAYMPEQQDRADDAHLMLVDEAPATADLQATLPPPPPPPPPAVVQAVQESQDVAPQEAASAAEFLPPPPAKADILDLTEDELATVLDGRSIDDELFDDDVIDITDGVDATDGFQFFGRD